MKKVMAVVNRQVPVSFTGGKWTYQTETVDVRVLSVAEGYAMVRRSGCVPFVIRDKELAYK